MTFYKFKFMFSNIKLLFLDFDGVLTDNFVYVSEDGVENVKCYRSDGIGISNLVKSGIGVCIVSTESNNVVLKRAEKLKIPAFNAIKDKARIVIEYSKKLKVELKDVAFLGNDINDIDVLKIVGHPFGVSDCFPELNKLIIYKTKRRGGEGAVRELCDIILSELKNT